MCDKRLLGLLGQRQNQRLADISRKGFRLADEAVSSLPARIKNRGRSRMVLPSSSHTRIGEQDLFIRVIDSKAVVFPCYDGNGMFYLISNFLGNPQVEKYLIDAASRET
jgi:hypothetical protein